MIFYTWKIIISYRLWSWSRWCAPNVGKNTKCCTENVVFFRMMFFFALNFECWTQIVIGIIFHILPCWNEPDSATTWLKSNQRTKTFWMFNVQYRCKKWTFFEPVQNLSYWFIINLTGSCKIWNLITVKLCMWALLKKNIHIIGQIKFTRKNSSHADWGHRSRFCSLMST